MARKRAQDRDNDILDEISKNISSWYSYYSDNLENMRNDEDFLYMSQWDSSDITEFARLSKPMLTFNITYDFFKKLQGEQRNNKGDLRVVPLGENVKQETMDIKEGLIRNIAFDSRADIVYETAFEKQTAGGFGAIGLRTEYESAKSFNQKIILIQKPNPERIFFDPNADAPTKHDGDFCGEYISMSKDKFEKDYPDIPYPASFPSLGPTINHFMWGKANTITLVEYFRKEYFTYTIHQLSDGTSITDKEWKERHTQTMGSEENSEAENQMDSSEQNPNEQQDLQSPQVPMMNLMQMTQPTIVASRKTTDYKIMRYKCICNKIIERSEWPGKEFPLICVLGDAHIVQGKEKTLSFVRMVKDAQRYLNYVGSEIAQAIKNNRREQFMGTPENISGFEQIWKQPSNQQGYLPARPDPITKEMPIRLPAPELPQTLLTQYERAVLDIQRLLGFSEPEKNSPSGEMSGIALRTRQKNNNLSAAIFFDNLARARAQVGRCIMSMIPNIYDSQRKISITDKNGESKDIIVNRKLPGDVVENDMSKGEFDVVLDSGPSFAVQREQAMEILVKLSQIDGVFPYIADLIGENIDIENSPRLKERLKFLVPPDVIAKEEGKPPPPQQPNPQMVMEQQQMQMKLQELQMKHQQAQMEMQSKMQEHQLDAARLQIELEKLQSEQQVERYRADAEIGKAQLEREADTANAMAKIATANAAIHRAQHGTLATLIKSHGANHEKASHSP